MKDKEKLMQILNNKKLVCISGVSSNGESKYLSCSDISKLYLFLESDKGNVLHVNINGKVEVFK